MKRYLLFLSFLLLTFLDMMGQSHKVDSLKALLSASKEDTNKVQLLNELIFELSYGNKHEALDRVWESVALSIKLQYDEGIYEAYDLLGIIYLDKGDLDSAEMFLLKAMVYFEDQEDERKLFNVYQKLGQVHVDRKSYKIASNYYKKELTIAMRLDDPQMIGSAYNDKASLLISKGWDRRNSVRDTANYISYFYDAVPYIYQSIEYFKKADHPKGVALAYGNLAILQEELYELDASMHSMSHAISYFERMNYKSYLVTAYNHLNRIHQKLNQYDSALYYLDYSLALAIELESKIDERNAYAQLSDVYYSLGNYKLAYGYHREFDEINNQILARNKQATIDELEVQYASRRQQHDLEIQEVENRHQKIIIFSGVVLLTAMLVVILIFWRKNQNERQLNVLLAQKSGELRKSNLLTAQQNAQLTESYNEQKNLMAVVAHDLRAPLNNLKALIGLVGAVGQLTEEQDELNQKALQVIEGGESLISDMVNLTRFENTIELRKEELHLNSFLAEILEIHTSYAERKGIRFRMNADSHFIYVETDKNHLTRIMDNLISNAIKFSPHDSLVEVQVMTGLDHVMISVVDQGPGMSSEDLNQAFQRFKKLSARPTGGENSTGLGLSIVKTLIEKLGGEITIESNMGMGTSFLIKLPCSEVLIERSQKKTGSMSDPA
ncbi:hypothetical protein BFP72_15810 [Reichenbachiella sp. 5M10]|uniref:ATP-binding protein n=1 Tax=Reichenbachiella sp. 5M10 TaxID=1889772 RepID=UPI000C158E10|nr:HAMP domain-containing sensor histidine kinase [Reichenbachiella sp. 5M10]PIB36760.1 hypothetical protein BFP72_15810 [Reichenbachiella sp. 5M10]